MLNPGSRSEQPSSAKAALHFGLAEDAQRREPPCGCVRFNDCQETACAREGIALSALFKRSAGKSAWVSPTRREIV